MAAATWQSRLATRVAQLDNLPWMSPGMPRSNANMIRLVVAPPADAKEPGARYVANIAAEHIPAFCDPNGPGYVNAYDLERMGENPQAVSPKRRRVDRALTAVTNIAAEDIYFGAAELNGSGIRFYGDLCLILQGPLPDDQMAILISNSYDLLREPLSAITVSDEALTTAAREMLGRWDEDLPAMAALKVFAYRSGERRLTTGQISDGLLDDEDYLEILRAGNFRLDEVEEVRISAPSAAAETRIAERIERGPPPGAAALLWRQRRRLAEAALDDNDIPMRVVATAGRVRG